MPLLGAEMDQKFTTSIQFLKKDERHIRGEIARTEEGHSLGRISNPLNN
jgi:hypothetical protein